MSGVDPLTGAAWLAAIIARTDRGRRTCCPLNGAVRTQQGTPGSSFRAALLPPAFEGRVRLARAGCRPVARRGDLALRAGWRHNGAMIRPPAIILAGGLATRMGGGDKCLLDLDGRPMLAEVIARLAPQCGAVALNANGDPARFAAFRLPVLPDSLPGFPGPLAGILTGMDWAASLGAGAVVSVAGDTPFFPRDLVARLAQAGHGIVLAAGLDEAGQATDHPTFGLWPVALRDDLAATLAADQRRVRRFAERHQPGRAVWPDAVFANINTPADLARAEARLAAL